MEINAVQLIPSPFVIYIVGGMAIGMIAMASYIVHLHKSSNKERKLCNKEQQDTIKLLTTELSKNTMVIEHNTKVVTNNNILFDRLTRQEFGRKKQ